MDLEKLRASDGTGPAALANIESERLVGATVIDVDNVENWPDEFIVVTGTLDANGYMTPATMTQMIAHLDSGDIVIDGFVPGYPDVGNTEGQVAIIKQTVHGQDSLVDLLQVTHDDDGSLKDDIVAQANMALLSVGTPELIDESVTSRKFAPTVIMESATGDLSLSSSTPADVPGCTTTLTPDIACYALVQAFVHGKSSAVGDDEFEVLLDVDGVDQPQTAVWETVTGGGQSSVAQAWLVPLTVASHTLKLQGKRRTGSGTGTVEADATKMIVMIIGDANVTAS